MQSLNISAAALRSVQQSLDTTANNLANMDTVGYKRRSASFSELLFDSMNEQPATDRQQRTSPAGLRIGSGVKLGMTRLDMTQGSAKSTGVPTDLMIEGEGFFAVTRQYRDASGVLREEFRITRNGAFQIQNSLSTLGGYTLMTPTGHYLVNDQGAPIIILDKVGEITITPDGQVLNDGELVDHIPVWKVDNPDQYQQVGENEWLVPVPAGNQFSNMFQQSTAVIRQGMLETSNVNMTEEMAQLVNTQRAYQLNSRAIAISDQMMGIANSLRSR